MFSRRLSLSPNFGYIFPSIRGIQAGREYYASMCKVRLIPKIFLFDEEELVPELRAQRILNKSRIPELSRYILDNKDSYVFSAITASIDGEVKFEPFSDVGDGDQLGTLHISMDSKFIINDGQHRRAAIEIALRENPDLGDEDISVVFFLDIGLHRSQQMFADLNRYAVKPSTSLGVLYDHRDEKAKIVRDIVMASPFFRDIVEMEKTSLSPRSKKLFTLSAFYQATNALLSGIDKKESELIELGIEYWGEVGKQFHEWQMVRDRNITSGDVRQEFIHSHGIVLQALGHVGNTLLKEKSDSWTEVLPRLQNIDWSRNNSKTWEGRAMATGRMSISGQNIILTSNYIHQTLGLKLSPESQRLEDTFLGEENGGR